MKKIKSLFAVVILAAFTTSCTKEDGVTSNEVQNQSVMRFATEEEMQAKIAEIKVFKMNQETQILEKLLKRNNVKAPMLADIESIKIKNISEFDKNTLLEDVKFYHQEKLKAIYAERVHFGFTSIQSIADEINFLKLLNPKKADILFNENSNLLFQNIYSVTPLVIDSEVTNVKGLVNINNNSVVSKLTKIKQGMVVSTALYAITYHVGVDIQSGIVIVPKNDKLFTKLGSYVNFGAGYVAYASWFYTNATSNCLFSPGLMMGCPNSYVPFPTGVGSEVTYEVEVPSSSCNGFYNPLNGNVSGTFVTPVGNTFMTLNGNMTF